MVTTTVGVRELKRDAPSLVQRAARGEHILITRYGQTLAELGPPVDAALGEPSRLTQWREERRAFERQRRQLMRRHRGKYVAISDGRVVGVDVDHDRLFERVWAKLGGKTFFIGRVGTEELVEMPGLSVL